MKLSILALSVLFSAPVFAGDLPRVDPALNKYLNIESDSNERVTVVVTFREGDVKVPLTDRDRASHGQVERQMIDSTRQNSAKLKQYLAAKMNVESEVKARQLWIINGIALNVPGKAIAELAKNPALSAVVSNHPVHIFKPHDHGEIFRQQLQGGGYTYGLKKLGVPELRAQAPNVNGKDVRIGILDTGIDASHPDLQGRLAGWRDFSSTGSKEPMDDHGHGTHVAGTIAGGDKSGTSIGLAPGAKILMGRIFDASGGGRLEPILEAMQWMADPDGDPKTNDFPVLVSNSWGGGSPSMSSTPAEQPFCKAVASWNKLGILPIFANGNSGPSPSSVNLPAGCPGTLAVGATDENDAIASFSSRGPAKWKGMEPMIKPTISAPGVKVISSVPGGKYREMSGTSMATPHVAGLATLLYQIAPNTAAPAMIQVISTSSQKLGDPNSFGAGRVSAFEAAKQLIKH